MISGLRTTLWAHLRFGLSIHLTRKLVSGVAGLQFICETGAHVEPASLWRRDPLLSVTDNFKASIFEDFRV